MAEGKFTKSDAVSAIYGKTGMSRREIAAVLDIFIHEVKSVLLQRGVVELRGFGTFEVKVRKARSGARNPRTGEAISGRSKAAVSFRPGRDLKLDAAGEEGGAPGEGAC